MWAKMLSKLFQFHKVPEIRYRTCLSDTFYSCWNGSGDYFWLHFTRIVISADSHVLIAADLLNLSKTSYWTRQKICSICYMIKDSRSRICENGSTFEYFDKNKLVVCQCQVCFSMYVCMGPMQSIERIIEFPGD